MTEEAVGLDRFTAIRVAAMELAIEARTHLLPRGAWSEADIFSNAESIERWLIQAKQAQWCTQQHKHATDEERAVCHAMTPEGPYGIVF